MWICIKCLNTKKLKISNKNEASFFPIKLDKLMLATMLVRILGNGHAYLLLVEMQNHLSFSKGES